MNTTCDVPLLSILSTLWCPTYVRSPLCNNQEHMLGEKSKFKQGSDSFGSVDSIQDEMPHILLFLSSNDKICLK